MPHARGFATLLALGPSLMLHLFTALQARAADPTVDQMQHWFDREWADAQVMPTLEGFGLRWRNEDHEMLPPNELQQLRASVAGHPDHPRRYELAAYDQKLKDGFIATRYVMYSLGEGRWRYNIDYPGGDFSDYVLTPDRAWSLSKTALAIFDRDAVEKLDLQQPVKQQENVFRFEIGSLLFGGLFGAELARLKPDPVKLAGNQWSVLAQRLNVQNDRQKYALEYHGRWDAQAGRGFIEKMVMKQNGARPEWVGMTHLFKDWTYDANLGRWIARRVEQTKPGGAPWRVLVYEGSARWPAGGFKALTTPPEAEGADPVRGPSVFKTLVDYRKRQIVTTTDSGVQTRELPVSSARASDRSALRTTGWIILGVLSAVFVVLWSRRRMGAA